MSKKSRKSRKSSASGLSAAEIAALVDFENLPDYSTLTDLQKRFVELRACRPDLSNTECYRQAGYKARNDQVARAGASRLMAQVNIQLALRAIRRQRREVLLASTPTWEEMLRDARDYLYSVVTGDQMGDRDRVKACIYIADRVEGKPRQSVDVRHGTLKDALDALDKGIEQLDERKKEQVVH